MTTREFFLKYNGVGIDFDGAYGFQCMDLFEQFNKDVVGGKPVYGNAIDVINKYPKDLYDFIANTPDNFPQEGDVVLWTNGIGQYGHIAVCALSDVNHFVSFDQNYPIGSLCHFQSHNYSNVNGWLRPKNLPQPPALVITDSTPIPLGVIGVTDYDSPELQALRSQILAKDQKIAELSTSAPTPPQNAPQQATVVFSNKFANFLYQLALAFEGKTG